MEQQPTWRVEVSSAVGHTSHTPTSSFTSCPRRSSTTDELPPRSRRIRCVWLVFRRRWLWFVINTQVVWLWLQQVVCVAAFRMYGYGSISSHREMHVRACCACVLAVYSTMCYWCMYSHLCTLKLKMRPSHSTQDTRTFTWRVITQQEIRRNFLRGVPVMLFISSFREARSTGTNTWSVHQIMMCTREIRPPLKCYKGHHTF